MPPDAQAQAVLDVINKGPRWETLTVAEVRRLSGAVAFERGPDVGNVEDRVIPGPGGDIPLRVYTPSGAGPFPALVWFHGGGWVIGSLDSADGACRRISVGTECVVVSVDYRLAPEARYPAAVEDAYAATAWVVSSAAEINVDGARVAVGGTSAGGNLAAVVPLMARERGGPSIVFQLLVVPVTDYNYNTTSYEEKAEGCFVTRAMMEYFWDLYLNDESEGDNPHASPMKAADLRGLPPALVLTAEFDPLCDDGARYAQRLQQAGVPTVYKCYEGTIHFFIMMPGRLDQGKQSLVDACGALKEAFRG